MTGILDVKRRLEAKRLEVVNYERILDAYRGRWYDMGRRHLASLREELLALETELAAQLADTPT